MYIRFPGGHITIKGHCFNKASPLGYIFIGNQREGARLSGAMTGCAAAVYEGGNIFTEGYFLGIGGKSGRQYNNEDGDDCFHELSVVRHLIYKRFEIHLKPLVLTSVLLFIPPYSAEDIGGQSKIRILPHIINSFRSVNKIEISR